MRWCAEYQKGKLDVGDRIEIVSVDGSIKRGDCFIEREDSSILKLGQRVLNIGGEQFFVREAVNA